MILYFVPRPERQALREMGELDAMNVPRWAERRAAVIMYRQLRTEGIRPALARSVIVNCLYIGRNATRIELDDGGTDRGTIVGFG